MNEFTSCHVVKCILVEAFMNNSKVTKVSVRVSLSPLETGLKNVRNCPSFNKMRTILKVLKMDV